MYDHKLYVQTLSDFIRTLVRPYDVDSLLNDLALRIADVLHLSGAGVSLEQEGKLRMVTVIPSHLAALEKYQENHQDGPSVEAFRDSRVSLIPDVEYTRNRWPEYVELARASGTSSIAVLPLALDERAFGTLSLYADRRDWPEDDVAAASLMADMATGYLINASTHHQQNELNDQLSHALESRVVIEQAKGIIAESRGLSVSQAFELIRRHARSHNVKVRDLSEAIVDMGLRI
ncbi:GAF and ANTAR domain-containing protein [Georgenia halophila]|uniref:GAF and ANTAR domain-containing protein n=1 Tax=Georgenia halophila TaxID=620889 RepID=A0ABP8LRP8_9MICO